MISDGRLLLLNRCENNMNKRQPMQDNPTLLGRRALQALAQLLAVAVTVRYGRPLSPRPHSFGVKSLRDVRSRRTCSST